MKAYEDLRVVEFTTNIAGPTIGRWLNEYGAEVIHIERPVVGDDSRHYPPTVNGQSLQYFTINHGKKSVTLDLKDPEGKEIACDIIKDADVLIESNRPGVMDRLGLGYDAMHALNPKLVYVSVSCWGQTGPYATRAGYDIIAQSASSLIYYNGNEEDGPVRVYTEIGDYVGALSGLAGVNMALLDREKTGKGQHVDISLVRALAMMSVKLDDCRIFNRKTEKLGNLGSSLLSPYGTYKCPDGKYITIATSNDNLAFKFLAMVGRSDLISDPRFATNEARVENNDITLSLLFEWLEKMGTVENAEKALVEAGVPCGKVYSFEDVDKDPHYHEAGWFSDIPLPETITDIRSRRIVGSPFGLSDAEPEYTPLEAFGNANQEIIGELGYTAEQIDQLQDRWSKAVNEKLEA